MKLTIELLPQTSFFKNIRSHVTKSKWDLIRRQIYKNANYKCEICNGKGGKHPVECHEIWNYTNNEQILIGLIALCPKCHMVKHYGFTKIRGLEHIAFAHLKKINKWTDGETVKYIEQSFTIWKQRSQQDWKLNMEFLKTLQYERT